MGRYKAFGGLGGKRKASVDQQAKEPEPDLAQPESETAQQLHQDLETSQNKTEQVNTQVAEVTEIMQTNVDKTLERGEHLQDMESQVGRLQESSKQFKENAEDVKNKLRMKQMRRAIIISVVVIVIILVLVAVGVVMLKKKKTKK